MKQNVFLTKAKKLANQILLYFRLMIFLKFCTLHGQKMKKRLFLSKNDLSWAKTSEIFYKYGHLFADCG